MIFIPIFSGLIIYIFVEEFTTRHIPAIQKSMNQFIRKYIWRNTLNLGDLEIQSTMTSEPTSLCLDLARRPLREHEAPSVRWLLETSTDQEVLLIAAQLVPDIEWPAEIDVSEACAQLKNAFTGCFVSTPGNRYNLALTPFGEKRAYFFAKALLHLSCIRQHSPNIESGNPESLIQYFNCLGSSEEAKSSFLPGMARGLAHKMAVVGTTAGRSIMPFERPWLLHLFPFLLENLNVQLTLAGSLPTVGDLVIAAVTEWFESPAPSRQILADCFLSAAIPLGVPIDQKDWYRIDKRVLLRELASVGNITADYSSRSAQAQWAEALLPPLAIFLNRGLIYPGFGKCESEECSCGMVNWTVGIAKSYALKATRAIEPDRKARAWKQTREALRLGAVLSATTPGNHPTQDRWNPAYHGHLVPFSFDINQSRWVDDFLSHHYDACDDMAIADVLFMLSQSRDIEKWADSPWFVAALVRAMQHSAMHVRHSALQVMCRMRRALARSVTDVQDFLHNLYAAVSINPPAAHVSDERPDQSKPDNDWNARICFLQIVYTFTLHHDYIWATDLFQTKVSEHIWTTDPFRTKISEDIWDTDLFKTEKSRYLSSYLRRGGSMPTPIYVIAILDTLEDRNAQCNFLNSFDQNTSITILTIAWFAAAKCIVHLGYRATGVEHPSLRIKSEILDEVLDETLPHLVAFTVRHQKTYSSAMAQLAVYFTGALWHLQQTRPESPEIALVQKLISDATPHS
ncbi:hypothetical protein BJ138DRAFT_1154462 [Hygrophoropsis aurantiaca]|uniref:Uncharacterized protein n=1 Tax=Hygrophoropsis aurantiaca TaxID=72124 RepID=A0ACB8A9K3_9AGAM|nr:hypothetical protein BJ138DRAFT_1154462 [Hygrophoropsis aurantiaca]